MALSSPIYVQWKPKGSADWRTLGFFGVPVTRNVKIRIDFSNAGDLPNPEILIDKIRRIFRRVQAKSASEETAGLLLDRETGDNLLEVLVSDGKSSFALDPRIENALNEEQSPLQSGRNIWLDSRASLAPLGSTRSGAPMARLACYRETEFT